MDDQTEKLKGLPDLPGLESVDASTFGRLWFLPEAICILVIGLMAGGIGWMCAQYRADILPDLRSRVVILTCLSIIALSVLWMLYRILWSAYRWKTDGEGLHSYALLRKRFIPWNEMEEIRPPRAISSQHSKARGKSQSIGLVAHNVPCSFLLASVYQHASKHIPVSLEDTPARVRSLWDTIPDTLPHSMDWRNPRPARPALANLLWHALLLAAAVETVFLVVGPRSWAILAGLYTATGMVGAWMLRRSSLITVSDIHIDDDGLIAHSAGGLIHLRWSDVTSAVTALDGVTIESAGKRLLVPHSQLKPDAVSDQLILAMIKRLREANPSLLLSIPEALRQAEPTAQASEETAENLKNEAFLRTSTAERVFCGICGIVLLGMIPALLEEHFHLLPLTGGSVALIAGLGYLMGGSYYYRLTPDAVEKRLFLYHRRIAWTQVAEVDFRITVQSQYLKWILRDQQGKKLLDVTLDLGSKQDKATFQSALTGHVSRLGLASRRPYLSRPFSNS